VENDELGRKEKEVVKDISFSKYLPKCGGVCHLAPIRIQTLAANTNKSQREVSNTSKTPRYVHS